MDLKRKCMLWYTAHRKHFFILMEYFWAVVAQMVKSPPAMQETQVKFLGQEDPLEKEVATYSSTLAWRIPWTEEPGGLQSKGSQRVRNDGVTNTHSHKLLLVCVEKNVVSGKEMLFIELYTHLLLSQRKCPKISFKLQRICQIWVWHLLQRKGKCEISNQIVEWVILYTM